MTYRMLCKVREEKEDIGGDSEPEQVEDNDRFFLHPLAFL